MRVFEKGERLTVKTGIWASWGMRARRGEVVTCLGHVPELPNFLRVQTKDGDDWVADESLFAHRRRRYGSRKTS